MLSLEEVVQKLSPQVDLPDVSFRGQTVLITGAGGSIGSALCRMLAQLGCHRMVLVDHSEYNLYQINKELVERGVITRPVLCSYGEPHMMSMVIGDYRPQVVFHAGAYKHVPLVEENPLAAVVNNVMHAETFFQVCSVFKVPKLVVVSSDKAVNPRSVMGATKAVVELLALSLLPDVKVVRFGNVLGSSGSVVPLFYAQLIADQPVTITHPEVTRYFMSIPQAVSLIIGCLQLPGTHFLLDMGAPIKILRLAQLIAEMLDRSLYVEYIGLRPGEKMYEELTHSVLEKTANSKVCRVTEPGVPFGTLQQSIFKLRMARTPEQVKTALMSLPIGYEPYASFDRMSIVGDLPAGSDLEDCYRVPNPNDYKE